MKNCYLKNWEISMLLALCITLCCGVWAQGQGSQLSSKLVRLHVIAVSDDEAEQELKLQVRDRVLEYLAPKLEGAEDAAAAREIIAESLSGIQLAAQGASAGREVTVTLGQENYPTREYGSFTLPAGSYESLRVVLGEGKGQNWWCVVFPPLCLSAAEADEAIAALGDDAPVLLDDSEPNVIIKFRLLELWGELKALLGI